MLHRHLTNSMATRLSVFLLPFRGPFDVKFAVFKIIHVLTIITFSIHCRVVTLL